MFVMLKKKLKFLEEIKKGKRESRKQNQKMFTEVTPASNDANICIIPGMYLVGENWLNTPVNYGILIVFKAGQYYVQMFRCVVTSSRSIYSRTSDGGINWSKWVDHQGV